jgi:hypothetical protein
MTGKKSILTGKFNNAPVMMTDVPSRFISRVILPHPFTRDNLIPQFWIIRRSDISAINTQRDLGMKDAAQSDEVKYSALAATNPYDSCLVKEHSCGSVWSLCLPTLSTYPVAPKPKNFRTLYFSLSFRVAVTSLV